mmetsp:Transcript_9046/g.18967  ORF Transcript_9046/g.18967 Transcript_9046/m.18967 type:complete len:324 (+) Transcript_9046:265-1236(+)|eukprot:CAMPEP_0201131656 /NCGR_PEP_ID=MMETSP0850-20130426/43336_1 /ASSEMBLY_ACC=CAM_ASM_000622 /TAXON_ID=183588 /ORGANISM="Pseudo-nitzschia fraudulenta, Strain WWA7" /LENGTH=323 /DNA_ID=CAMNT_0047401745 /DNA_START=130 /DNA_END=1101 /DNA_ORIENTATION=+
MSKISSSSPRPLAGRPRLERLPIVPFTMWLLLSLSFLGPDATTMDKDAVVVGCSKTRTSIVVAAFQQQQRQQQQPRLRLPRSFRSRLPELQGQKPFPGRFEAPRSVVPAPRSSRVPLFFSGSRCRHRNSCRGEQPKTDFHRNTRHGPLFGGTPNNNNGDGDSSNDKNGPKEETSSSNTNKERMVRMKRVGGRRRNREKPRDDDETNETNLDNNQKPSGLFSWWKNNLSASFVLTALLVLTLLKNLFFGGGGGGTDSNYYYYSYSSSSSIVYETRTNPDGSRTTTETSRNDSSNMKSNIPGLTKGGSSGTDVFIFDNIALPGSM